MSFPYERYETLAEALTVYYPTDQATLARWLFQSVDRASKLLAQLLDVPIPEMEILLVVPPDWDTTPQDEAEEGEAEEPNSLLPYWTDATEPPSLVVPTQIDPIIGSYSPEKLASWCCTNWLTHSSSRIPARGRSKALYGRTNGNCSSPRSGYSSNSIIRRVSP